MAGGREPIELVIAKGKKHLTKAEIAQRRATEVTVARRKNNGSTGEAAGKTEGKTAGKAEGEVAGEAAGKTEGKTAGKAEGEAAGKTEGKTACKTEKGEAEGKTEKGKAAARGTEGETQVRAPVWLPSWLRGEFNELRTQLTALGVFAKLDRDCLAMYCLARHSYTAAGCLAQEAISQSAGDEAAGWSNIQNRYFGQCRACAAELGMSISARCKLVVPQVEKPRENPLAALMEKYSGKEA